MSRKLLEKRFNYIRVKTYEGLMGRQSLNRVQILVTKEMTAAIIKVVFDREVRFLHDRKRDNS